MVYQRKRNRSMRRRPKRLTRRKEPRKIRRYQRRYPRIPGSLQTIPHRLPMKFNYAFNNTWSVPPGPGWYNGNYFQSSLYQPQLPLATGGAHQPMYFDQFCPAMYYRYRVYGIKYSFRFTNYTINDTWYASVEHNNSSPVASTDLLAAMERPGSRVKIGGQQYSSSNFVTIKGYMDVAKTLGVSRYAVRNDNDYSAPYNATPSAGNMALVSPFLMTTSSGAATFTVTGKLKYYAILESRIQEVKS